MKNKIGWCDMTWNPVWGCNNRGECKKYCYARAFAKRFGRSKAKSEYKDYICEVEEGEDAYDVMRLIRDLEERLRFFIPTFIHSNFEKSFPKKPQRIFVGSMSEVAHWEKRWMEDLILDKIKEYPQHTFMFLTKYPEVYAQYLFAQNCWYGVTMTRNKPIERVGCIPIKRGIKFLSIEPLLEKIDIKNIDDFKPDWVIIGAETGNRKGKVIPNLDWVLEIVRYCEHHKIPVYIKDNLTKYYAECRGYKQFPKGVKV